jgi:phosphoribosylanthranilate isomerase
MGDYDGYFDALQFYDAKLEQNRAWLSGEFRLVYACRIKDMTSLDALTEVVSFLHAPDPLRYSPLHAILLDTYHKDKLGGSGETFNWELAVEAKRRFDIPIILAGGLTPENVEEAISTVRPYAVDVSSGVEAEPGRKDHTKLKAFFEAVRRADSIA